MLRQLLLGFTGLLMVGGNVALGGGYYLQYVEPSAASANAEAGDAIAVLQVHGCGEPWLSQVRASAVGIVDGERRELPLTVISLSRNGYYAIRGNLPSSGNWIIAARGSYRTAQATVIAFVRNGHADRSSAQFRRGHPGPDELDAILRTEPALAAQQLRN